MFPGRIFTESSNTSSGLPTKDRIIDSDLQYEISETINSITEDSHNICIEHMRDTYYYLKENNIFLLESGMENFIKRVNKFSDSITNSVMQFNKKTLSYNISSALEFEKFLNANKNVIKNVNRRIRLNNGYNYTIPESGSPDLDILDKFILRFNEKISTLDGITREFIELESRAFNQTWQESVRAVILGKKKSSISAGEFITETRKFYRDNQTTPVSIIIDNEYLNNILTEYPKHRKLLSVAKVESDEIIGYINEIKKCFNDRKTICTMGSDNVIKNRTINKHGPGNIIYTDGNPEMLKLINEYYNLQFANITFLYTTILNVYFQKIYAIQEYLRQSEKIVRFALFDNDSNNLNIVSEVNNDD